VNFLFSDWSSIKSSFCCRPKRLHSLWWLLVSIIKCPYLVPHTSLRLWRVKIPLCTPQLLSWSKFHQSALKLGKEITPLTVNTRKLDHTRPGKSGFGKTWHNALLWCHMDPNHPTCLPYQRFQSLLIKIKTLTRIPGKSQIVWIIAIFEKIGEILLKMHTINLDIFVKK
jgi:hypothetical protein